MKLRNLWSVCVEINPRIRRDNSVIIMIRLRDWQTVEPAFNSRYDHKFFCTSQRPDRLRGLMHPHVTLSLGGKEAGASS